MALSDYLRLDWLGQPSRLPERGQDRSKNPLPAVDITEHIESLDKFTDVGTGETCSASLMLRAHGGNFVTEKNGDDADDSIKGATPIIKPFDLFRLAVVDDEGSLCSSNRAVRRPFVLALADPGPPLAPKDEHGPAHYARSARPRVVAPADHLPGPVLL